MLELSQSIEAKAKLVRAYRSLEKKKAEQSLYSFYVAAWHVIEPQTPLLLNWHIELVSEYLELVAKQEIKRLIINIPPRYSKSNLVTVMFPAWVWTRAPAKRFMTFSYSVDLSTKHSVDRRMIIQSEWYQRAWADKFQILTDQNLKTEYLNTHRGHCTASSIGGTSTGKGGNIIIVDDPIDPRRANSDAERKTANEFYKTSIQTRLNDKKKDAIVIVMQRLHDDDLTGMLVKEQADEWTVVKIPAQSEEDHEIVFPVSGKVIERPTGDILWPEREGQKELTLQKKTLGSWSYEGQYQQNPAPKEGGIIKRSWFKFYKRLPETWDQKITSWDLTFKEKKTSDYVAAFAVIRKGADRYFCDHLLEQLGYVNTRKAFRNWASKHSEATAHIIEDKANGSALINDLQSEILGLIPIEPVGDKVERLEVASPQVESGNVYLPADAPWVDDFIDRITKFPNVTVKDDIDAFSQALIYLKQRLTVLDVI